MPYLNQIRSSLHLPSSSWLALYGELGLLGLVVAVLVVVKAILFFRRYRSRQFRMLNLMMLTLIYYLVFMGFQNVYLEYTQAIFPAVLSVKLCYDFLQNEFALSRRVRFRVKAKTGHQPAG
jgi:lipopolysaccharide export LptBFGC system permease protein LptF